LSNFYADTQFGSITTARARWAWGSGSDIGTAPSVFNVISANLSLGSDLAQRLPVYKTVVAIKYPKLPSPNFPSVEVPAASTMVWFPATGNTVASEFVPFRINGAWNP
jgi:hypothetical protein